MKEFKGVATKEINKRGKTTMIFGKIKKGEVWQLGYQDQYQHPEIKIREATRPSKNKFLV